MRFDQFVEEWCLGQEPAAGRQTQEWLATVARVAPGRYGREINGQARGPAVIVPLIEMGQVIEATQGLEGSGPVLRRLAAGDDAAYSELRVARFLVERDLVVELEPELSGRRPDFRIVAPDLVYGEVITPQFSQPTQELQKSLHAAAGALLQSLPSGHHLEVAIFQDGDAMTVAESLASVVSEPGSRQGVADFRGSRATYVMTAADPSSDQQLVSQIDLPAPVIFVATLEGADEGSRMVVCRQSVTDDRAGRIIEAESKHFTREHPTLVIMDNGPTPFGERTWAEPIRRRFQPSMNTRFSSVGFFRRSFMVGHGVHETQWSLLLNPHALNPLPPAVVERLGADMSV